MAGRGARASEAAAPGGGLWHTLTWPWRTWVKPGWESQRDHHLLILSILFFGAVAAAVEALGFMLFAFGEMPEGHWSITTHWLLLIGGAILAVWVGPGWIHYWKHWGELKQVLHSQVRSEVRKTRREAEQSAALLGSWAEARLDDHLVELGLLRARRSTTKGAKDPAASRGKEASPPRSAPSEVGEET